MFASFIMHAVNFGFGSCYGLYM